ncbi:MAG: YjgP/YjgQ family permease [Bacteroidales bacterium]|nr:YjgP/YjgQ family permease [Bacteroidales bacterium]
MQIFRKLDWYIIRKFILTFIMMMALIILIVIIFDISEKIDKFIAHEAPLKKIIFDYYVNFIPYFINMYSPMFVFLTVIFFTSRMAANSEIVAMLSCGTSFHRLMLPYMVSATIIAVLSLALNLWVIPESNKTRVAFETKYVKESGYTNTNRNIHYQIAPGEFAYVESFSTWNNTAYHFTLEKIEGTKLVSKLVAESATWDSVGTCWRLKKWFERDYTDDMSDHIRSGEERDTSINLTVADFYFRKKTVETLNNNELRTLIDTQKMRGDSGVKYAQIEKHTRYSLPFSAFILTIIGVALSSKKKRGGIGWNLAIGIALSFSYVLFMRFSQMFVHTGALPAGIALWLPNVIFAIIAAVLYRIAPK